MGPKEVAEEGVAEEGVAEEGMAEGKPGGLKSKNLISPIVQLAIAQNFKHNQLFKNLNNC